MALVNLLTAERMLEIEGASVIDGDVDANGNLILTKHNGGQINAGNVRGPAGPTGRDAAPGSVAPSPGTTPIRTNDSRIKTATPIEIDDAATMGYVDGAAAIRRKIALAQRLLSGGGIRQVDASSITWSQRLMIMGLGLNSSGLTGYFNIDLPANGTIIPVYGTTDESSVTVASGRIPLSGWRALYYDLPLGSAYTSDPSRFRIMDYHSSAIEIPSTWVLIAVRNGDPRAAALMWGDGRTQDVWKPLTLTNSWVMYNSSWGVPSWRFTGDGQIRLRGMISAGTVGITTPFATLSIDLAPDGGTNTGALFHQPSNGGIARVDILSDGRLTVHSIISGNNTFISLQNVQWYPKGT